MNGFVVNIEHLTEENEDFRRVIYTTEYCQLVLMSLKAGEEIGEEVHHVDQFFRVEEGSGRVIINGISRLLEAGFAIIVPAGVTHNILADTPLKLYTLYAPPQHKDGTIHQTRAAAQADTERFDGKTTE